MSRLWEKGLPLDERVLRYTAGEDHSLDDRLIEYDVRASIAHANMLHHQQLLLHRHVDDQVQVVLQVKQTSPSRPDRKRPGSSRASSTISPPRTSE